MSRHKLGWTGKIYKCVVRGSQFWLIDDAEYFYKYKETEHEPI
ncbi:MAG: hypothetical protein AABY07_10265 [Nanoarchaeota archaeon]